MTAADAPPWEPIEARTATAHPAVSSIEWTPAADVTPRAPSWIWRRWLTVGGLHLVIGRQGGGKSTLAAWVVAHLTTGQPLPGEGEGPTPPLRCAMLSHEEPDERVAARLRAAGAHLAAVGFLGLVSDLSTDPPTQRLWNVQKDHQLLRSRIQELGLDFVVIDGLGYSISGDSHNYAVVGSALATLRRVADDTNCTILGLTHPPKGGSDPVTAAVGSTGWTAIPRITWVLGVERDDEERRAFHVGKSNYAKPEHGFSFSIEEGEWEAGRVTRVASSAMTAAELTAAPDSPAEKGERYEAQEFLRERLAAGPVDASDIGSDAQALGISATTLKRARHDLGVVSTRQSDPRSGRCVAWLLALPSPDGHQGRWSSGPSGADQGEP